jgi:hypothetical protein
MSSLFSKTGVSLAKTGVSLAIDDFSGYGNPGGTSLRPPRATFTIFSTAPLGSPKRGRGNLQIQALIEIRISSRKFRRIIYCNSPLILRKIQFRLGLNFVGVKTQVFSTVCNEKKAGVRNINVTSNLGTLKS